MTTNTFIRGWGSQIGPTATPIGDAVQRAVHAALQSAQMTLADVDMVVTVGSDILDGAMVATNSGIAGYYGKEILTVPSSAGHAFDAAVSLIISGQAATVLLAGWGEGTKVAAHDSRAIQADPFYARAVGAEPTALAALQAQYLVTKNRLDLEKAARYAADMRNRAGYAEKEAGRSGAAKWLSANWCDGACAIVLSSKSGAKSVAVGAIGTSFQPYCPEPDQLDPAAWVRAASNIPADASAIEVGAPTPFAELAALDAVKVKNANKSGGSAAAYFGPATGLQRIIAVADQLRADGGKGIAIDMAGPIGQATTVVVLGGAS